jgi:outer membrane protein
MSLTHFNLRPGLLQAAAAAGLCLFSLGASAQGLFSGTTFYIGGAYIDVHSKADPLTSKPETLPEGVKAGVRIGDASTVGLGMVMPIAGNYSFELALGIPPTHSGYGTMAISAFGQISTMKQVSPTAFVNYHFSDGGLGMAPFIGAGINYTKFTNGKSTASGDAASGGPTTQKLSDSVGLAAHAGLTYKLDKNWSMVGTIAYADVTSDLTATTTARLPDGLGPVVRTTTISFRPLVYTLSVGYTF